MKYYKVVFGVPDNFNSDELKWAYNKDNVNVCKEGFVEVDSLDENLADKLDLSSISTKDNDVVICKVDAETFDDISLVDLRDMVRHIEKVVGRPVVMLPNDSDLTALSKKEAVDMLEDMIQKLQH